MCNGGTFDSLLHYKFTAESVLKKFLKSLDIWQSYGRLVIATPTRRPLLGTAAVLFSPARPLSGVHLPGECTVMTSQLGIEQDSVPASGENSTSTAAVA